jgi:uncharacterized membrane protein YfhO
MYYVLALVKKKDGIILLCIFKHGLIKISLFLPYAALTASVKALAVAAMASQSPALILSWSNAGATKPTEDAPFLK